MAIHLHSPCHFHKTINKWQLGLQVYLREYKVQPSRTIEYPLKVRTNR